MGRAPSPAAVNAGVDGAKVEVATPGAAPWAEVSNTPIVAMPMDPVDAELSGVGAATTSVTNVPLSRTASDVVKTTSRDTATPRKCPRAAANSTRA
jgi:hypothetical protein